MNSIVKPLLFILFLQLLSGSAYPQKDPGKDSRCDKVFRISGPRADGNGTWTSEVTLQIACNDFKQEDIPKQLSSEDKNYDGYNYKRIAPPTWTSNCAGRVFEKLFNKGPMTWNATEFEDKLLVWFGEKIYNPRENLTWGDVRPGDVVIYRKEGKPKHVAYVDDVIKNLGMVTDVIIESKADEESVFLHPIGLTENMFDPLKHNYGDIYIYRINTEKLRIEDISPKCECPKTLESQTLKVSNAKPEIVYTSDILEDGADYLIEASGTVSDWDTKNPEGVDACYCYIKWRCPNPEPWGQLLFDDKSMHQIKGSTIPYTESHNYSVHYKGTGKKMKIHCYDAIGSSGDNSGFFTVIITKQR